MVIVVCSRKHLLLGVSVYVIAVFPRARCGDSVYTCNIYMCILSLLTWLRLLCLYYG